MPSRKDNDVSNRKDAGVLADPTSGRTRRPRRLGGLVGSGTLAMLAAMAATTLGGGQSVSDAETGSMPLPVGAASAARVEVNPLRP